MLTSSEHIAVLNGNKTSFILTFQNGTAHIAYWGKKLSRHATADMLRRLQLRQEVAASPTREIPLSLCPSLGQGFTGHPGIELTGSRDQWAVVTKIVETECVTPQSIVIKSVDEQRRIALTQRVTMDKESDVIEISTQVKQLGADRVTVNWCNAACFAVPHHADSILAFEGHWANEFQEQRSTLNMAAYVRENRRGRTSHDSFPGIILHDKYCHQQAGSAYGFHLGWSGNHKIIAEKMADGRAYVQLGESLLPGEISLASGEVYTSPTVYASYSEQGLNALSEQFHRYVRHHLIDEQIKNKPRPVHYNTWEGIYFDHNMETLFELAEKASAIGVERFVLDDGWFPGRNDDRAGLGDWYVDNQKYPQGLGPLVNKVNDLGMEFGLWFEPEMVNPDSDLFRAHPDWVLSTPPNQDMGFRNQLVLDLTNQEVFNYLFERLDSILSEYNIAYVKWDMNRDVLQAGDISNLPAVHRQTHSLYELLAKLRQAHPGVEIESCSSGGGRADYAVLKHTDRIWTSDSNDALNRLSIQKGFSYFFPPELMGSHVGPRDCHITHRHLSMALRCATAMFGHMGMEMDLRELSEQETRVLKQAVALYKSHRHLIHQGRLVRLDLDPIYSGFGYVNADQSRGLYSYTLLDDHAPTMPGTFRFAGLCPDTTYQLDVIWPMKDHGFWPNESLFHFDTCLPEVDGQHFTGELLMQLGLQLPRLVPQTALVFELTKVKTTRG